MFKYCQSTVVFAYNTIAFKWPCFINETSWFDILNKYLHKYFFRVYYILAFFVLILILFVMFLLVSVLCVGTKVFQ